MGQIKLERESACSNTMFREGQAGRVTVRAFQSVKAGPFQQAVDDSHNPFRRMAIAPLGRLEIG